MKSPKSEKKERENKEKDEKKKRDRDERKRVEKEAKAKKKEEEKKLASRKDSDVVPQPESSVKNKVVVAGSKKETVDKSGRKSVPSIVIKTSSYGISKTDPNAATNVEAEDTELVVNKLMIHLGDLTSGDAQDVEMSDVQQEESVPDPTVSESKANVLEPYGYQSNDEHRGHTPESDDLPRSYEDEMNRESVPRSSSCTYCHLIGRKHDPAVCKEELSTTTGILIRQEKIFKILCMRAQQKFLEPLLTPEHKMDMYHLVLSKKRGKFQHYPRPTMEGTKSVETTVSRYGPSGVKSAFACAPKDEFFEVGLAIPLEFDDGHNDVHEIVRRFDQNDSDTYHRFIYKYRRINDDWIVSDPLKYGPDLLKFNNNIDKIFPESYGIFAEDNEKLYYGVPLLETVFHPELKITCDSFQTDWPCFVDKVLEEVVLNEKFTSSVEEVKKIMEKTMESLDVFIKNEEPGKLIELPVTLLSSIQRSFIVHTPPEGTLTSTEFRMVSFPDKEIFPQDSFPESNITRDSNNLERLTLLLRDLLREKDEREQWVDKYILKVSMKERILEFLQTIGIRVANNDDGEKLEKWIFEKETEVVPIMLIEDLQNFHQCPVLFLLRRALGYEPVSEMEFVKVEEVDRFLQKCRDPMTVSTENAEMVKIQSSEVGTSKRRLEDDEESIVAEKRSRTDLIGGEGQSSSKLRRKSRTTELDFSQITKDEFSSHLVDEIKEFSGQVTYEPDENRDMTLNCVSVFDQLKKLQNMELGPYEVKLVKKITASKPSVPKVLPSARELQQDRKCKVKPLVVDRRSAKLMDLWFLNCYKAGMVENFKVDGKRRRDRAGGESYSTSVDIDSSPFSASGVYLGRNGSDPCYAKFRNSYPDQTMIWLALGDHPDNGACDVVLIEVDKRDNLMGLQTVKKEVALWPTLSQAFVSFPGPFYYRRGFDGELEVKKCYRCKVCGSTNHDEDQCGPSIYLRRCMLKLQNRCMNCLEFLGKPGIHKEDVKKFEEVKQKHVCNYFAACYHCKHYGHHRSICGSEKHLIYLLRPNIFFSLEQMWEVDSYSVLRSGCTLDLTNNLRNNYDLTHHVEFVKACQVIRGYRNETYEKSAVCITEYDVLKSRKMLSNTRLLHKFLPGPGQNGMKEFLVKIGEMKIGTWPYLTPEAVEHDWLQKVQKDHFAAGYQWCVEAIKQSVHSTLATELEMSKAGELLKQGDVEGAKEVLKVFHSQDSKISGTAANNLAMISLLQGGDHLEEAEAYSNHALTVDHYNANALVNAGNIWYQRGELDKAMQHYREALTNDAECVQALYNMGLVSRQQGNLEQALECFYKLQQKLSFSVQVMCQLAAIYESLEDSQQAGEFYGEANDLEPSDPAILEKLADIHDAEGDKSQAFQYNYDSYRAYPSNMKVIQWIGGYYIESQYAEKAANYFEKASIMQPSEIKWQLMMASSHRRAGNYQRALELYKSIHRKFPSNLDCLKFLVRLCTDLGMSEAREYAEKLQKAERVNALRAARESDSSQGKRHSANSTSNSLPPPTAGGERPNSLTGLRMSSAHFAFEDKPYEVEHRDMKSADFSYADPVGPAASRPKTGSRRQQKDDSFDDLDESLLPQ